MSAVANDNGNGDWSHVEITSGTIVKAPELETENGIRVFPELIGAYRFFIDAIYAGGIRLCVDDCESYDEAIRLAEQTRIDFEIDQPLRDLVAGGAQ